MPFRDIIWAAREAKITIGIHGKKSAALSLVQITLQKSIIPPSIGVP